MQKEDTDGWIKINDPYADKKEAEEKKKKEVHEEDEEVNLEEEIDYFEELMLDFTPLNKEDQRLLLFQMALMLTQYEEKQKKVKDREEASYNKGAYDATILLAEWLTSCPPFLKHLLEDKKIDWPPLKKMIKAEYLKWLEKNGENK